MKLPFFGLHPCEPTQTNRMEIHAVGVGLDARTPPDVLDAGLPRSARNGPFRRTRSPVGGTGRSRSPSVW